MPENFFSCVILQSLHFHQHHLKQKTHVRIKRSKDFNTISLTFTLKSSKNREELVTENISLQTLNQISVLDLCIELVDSKGKEEYLEKSVGYVFWIALLQAVVVFTPSPLSKNVGN